MQRYPQKKIQSSPSVNTIKTPLLGGVHINYILWVFLPSLILACLYSYHMAVKQKQERPFPHATITATACHYPQDIEFRFVLMLAGSFLNLVYFVTFKWTTMIMRDSQFPFKIEGWLFPVAQISVLGLYFATATIDGSGTTAIHGPGAVFYFAVLLLCVSYLSFILRELKMWCSSIISRISCNIKVLLAIYINLSGLYSLYRLMSGQQQNDDPAGVVIIEWNLAIGSMIWLLSFVLDWKDVFVTLRGDFSSTVTIMPQFQ